MKSFLVVLAGINWLPCTVAAFVSSPIVWYSFLVLCGLQVRTQSLSYHFRYLFYISFGAVLRLSGVIETSYTETIWSIG